MILPHIGGTANITIELTVPFVCNSEEFQDYQCALEFEIVISKGRKKICKNKPPFLGTAQPGCKTKVPGILVGNPATKQTASMIYI